MYRLQNTLPSSRYSKKTYTQRQLSVLLLLKIYLSEDYQYNIAFREVMDSVSQKILIEEVLHLVL
jgi:hypothetical protein